MPSKITNRHGKEFLKSTRINLAERVAYMCSNPYCRKLTIKPSSDKNIAIKSGKASHIISASPNGPRADDTKSPHFIRSFDNGIWLCDKCAREVDDNQSIYKKEELIKWKFDAETYVESLVTQDTRLRQLRLLIQNYLSALRILSALPSKLDQTFENPNGNNINLTRLFMELELVLFDNKFLEEANRINSIIKDLDKNVCPFVHSNKSEYSVNISNWKNLAVKILMVDIMRFTAESYSRYLQQETEMVNDVLDSLKAKSIVPTELPLKETYIATYI
ncbi:hypothetical protein LK994_01910 [Ferruginibacter lapsinanis]|uniref:hypothetical protein n=1 Tax=Ferruginibacter lapsinanis TaxID=563172 RepID=UPI001E57A09E|nr:hypothetical protein [Ferruginibacter lapsinanis]UEG50229.1 hypothetical protein LK994_01910 [Ferruginibacter lapsinanis]